jgi:predicted HTH transcriptional regulator
LPPLWWELDYDTFLEKRRERMAKVIEAAWQALKGTTEEYKSGPMNVGDLIQGGESSQVEFKSTLRVNLHTGQVDEKIQMAALKTIVGFLNSSAGGTLLVGVADDGEVLGVATDDFANEDKMALHLVNLIRDRIGQVFLPYVHPRFDDQDGGRVLAVQCESGPKPAFVKDGAEQRFFVRGGNATTELRGADVTEYVRQRFP